MDYSALRIQIFEGSIPYKGSLPIDDPVRLLEESYYFDILMSNKCGWRFQSQSGKFFTTDQLVERSMEELMERIKADKAKD